MIPEDLSIAHTFNFAAQTRESSPDLFLFRPDDRLVPPACERATKTLKW
jgi:hypothetical protein